MNEIDDCRRIGKNILRLRKEKNLLEIEVALELDYSTANYSKIENGQIWPDCYALSTLCRIFQCQPETIIYEEQPAVAQREEDYFSSLPESEKRRLLRILYLAFHCETFPFSPAFHNLFGSCVLDKSLSDQTKHMPIVLEYERNIRNLTRRQMADFLNISKNKYYALISHGECSDIRTLMQIHQTLGYPMSYLLWNQIMPSYFFSSLETIGELPDTFARSRELFVKAEEYGELILEFQSRRSHTPQ